MKLFLVDSSLAVFTAMEQAFAAHPEVTVSYGNILAVAENTLVSPANSYGYMDGGIDEVYVEFFGLELQSRVLATIDCLAQGVLPVGSAALVKTGHSRIPFLIVAPTMEIPGPIPPAKVFFAMSAILRLASNHENLTKVYCPGLGTGVGRVEPEVAAGEMEAAYSKWLAHGHRSRPTHG